MKSIKFIRAMIFMLTVSCLLVALMGCGGAEKTNGGTSESTSASESSEITANTVSSESASASESSEIKDEDMSEKEDLIEKMKKDFKRETLSFTAEPFAQGALSWEYSLTVKIRNDQLYFGNDLYGDAICEKNPIVINSPLFFKDKYKDNGESIVNEIKNSEYCYIAEADGEAKYGQKIAIYFIDNSYYFVSFNEHNEVLRIHCKDLNKEDLYESDSESSETETQESTTEEQTVVKENPEKSPELNALFETLQKDDEQSEKMKFHISYQDLHYELKESEKYDNEKWRNYSISLNISCNYNLAVEEDWYKACEDTEIKTLNIALFNEYKAELSDGHFSSYGLTPALYFTYSYSEETMIETLALFYSDYEVLKRLLDFEYVTLITVTYYYSVPGSFFDD